MACGPSYERLTQPDARPFPRAPDSLLFAHRIFRQFAVALLFQSALIIAVQLWLLHLCVRAQRQTALERRQPLRRLRGTVPPHVVPGPGPGPAPAPALTPHPHPPCLATATVDRVLADFWRWDAYEDYLIVLTGFFWTLCCASYVVSAYGDADLFAEILGALAVAFEIAFPIPQMRKIVSTGSAAGVRYVQARRPRPFRSPPVPYTGTSFNVQSRFRWEMVATWWVGDVLKTTYFVLSEAPAQFFVCGLLQLILDTVLAGQLVIYHRREPGSADEPTTPALVPTALLPLGSSLVGASSDCTPCAKRRPCVGEGQGVRAHSCCRRGGCGLVCSQGGLRRSPARQLCTFSWCVGVHPALAPALAPALEGRAAWYTAS